MPPFRGFIESNGLPTIQLEVVGQSGTEKITAIVDTGYTGHLTLLKKHTTNLNLKILGVESGFLADGSLVPYLECEGTLVLGELRIRGIIDVQEGRRNLLGMAFIKEAGLTLKCDPLKKIIELVNSRQS